MVEIFVSKNRMNECICEHSNPEEEVVPNITEKVKELEQSGS